VVHCECVYVYVCVSVCVCVCVCACVVHCECECGALWMWVWCTVSVCGVHCGCVCVVHCECVYVCVWCTVSVCMCVLHCECKCGALWVCVWCNVRQGLWCTVAPCVCLHKFMHMHAHTPFVFFAYCFSPVLGRPEVNKFTIAIGFSFSWGNLQPDCSAEITIVIKTSNYKRAQAVKTNPQSSSRKKSCFGTCLCMGFRPHLEP